MSLVYRSVFADADGRISAAVPATFDAWLRSKGLITPDGGLASAGAALESQEGAIAWAARSSVSASERQIQRLRLVEESNEARWVTTLSWHDTTLSAIPGESWLWIDLEHEPVGGRPLKRPGSPRLVRELLAAGEAVDGGVPLTSEVWQIRAEQTAELLHFVTSPTRHIPIIVFAYDSQRAYDQFKLANSLARDLAGVAAVFRLTDVRATERFAQLLPEGLAVYGGAMRTYLPGAGSVDDAVTRHRVLGRASLSALGTKAFPAVKDQVLEFSVRRGTPLPSLSVRGSSKLIDATPVAPAALGTASLTAGVFNLPWDWLQERFRRVRRSLGQSDVPEQATTDRLTQFDNALNELIAATRTTVQAEGLPAPDPIDRQLAEARAEQALSDQLLEVAQSELDQSSVELQKLRDELEAIQLEATEAAEATDRAERRGRWLSKRLREVGDSDFGTDNSLPGAPPSVAEVLLLARQLLSWVIIGPTDETAAELDLQGSSQLYAIKSWSGLVALNAYAQARVEGRFSSSFYSWCQEAPAGEPAISAAAVALMESETVGANTGLRRSRTFPVPREVENEGRLYMPAHIKVVKRGWPCPRLHFHDDTAGTGKIYVGYLGEHLPTAQFR